MPTKDMKQCSTSLGHKGPANQNYTEIPPHLSQTGNHQEKNNKCWQGHGGKGTLTHCWWECKLVQPLWKSPWRFLNKLVLGIYLKECKSIHRRYLHTHAFMLSSQWPKLCNQPRCPTTNE
jgi:hypothetical protein